MFGFFFLAWAALQMTPESAKLEKKVLHLNNVLNPLSKFFTLNLYIKQSGFVPYSYAGGGYS